MSIAEVLANPQPRRCVVQKMLEEIQSDDWAAIMDYFAKAREDKELRPHATRYPMTKLAQVLDKAGYHISTKALCKHAFRDCICEYPS
jgi:hypothetical protein